MNGHNNHNHAHNENCACGHAHSHENLTHVHGENCTCGHSHNSHTPPAHLHGENCGCQAAVQETIGAIRVECHLHDDARVISGELSLFADYGKLKDVLSAQLEILAKEVLERGGIVGHIKASCRVETVEMFSVTDVAVAVKIAPGQDIKINLASIVFGIDPDDAKVLVKKALEAVKAGV